MEPLGRRGQALAVDVIAGEKGGEKQGMNATRGGLAGGAAPPAAAAHNDGDDAAAADLSPSHSHRAHAAAADVAVESDNSDDGYQCAAYEIGETGDVDC
jgi:hypothetical protein